MANTLPNDAAFYVQATLCYGAACAEVEVPWTRDFSLLPKGQDVCILSHPFGKWAPGLYVRPDLKTWCVALNFTDVCGLNLQANRVAIHVYNQQLVQYDNTYQVYRNSFLMQDARIEASVYDVWVVIKLGASASSFAIKPVPSASPNVLQVSTTDTGIQDYQPTVAGLVKVDAAGIASTLTLEELAVQLTDAFN